MVDLKFEKSFIFDVSVHVTFPPCTTKIKVSICALLFDFLLFTLSLLSSVFVLTKNFSLSVLLLSMLVSCLALLLFLSAYLARSLIRDMNRCFLFVPLAYLGNVSLDIDFAEKLSEA